MFEYSKKHQPNGLGVISHGDSSGLLNAGAHGLVDVAFWCARISWQLLYTSIKQSSRGLALWRPKGRKAQSRWTRESLGVLHPCATSISHPHQGVYRHRWELRRAEFRPHSTLLRSPLLGPQPSLWILQSRFSKDSLYKFHDLYLRARKRINKETLLGSVPSCGTVLREKKGSLTYKYRQILCIMKCNTTELKGSHRMGKRWGWHI